MENIRIEVIELNVGSSLTQAYNFGQLPNLRDAARIISVEAYDNGQVTLSPLNKSVVLPAVLKKAYLELVESGNTNAVLVKVPLVDISKQNAASVIEKLDLPTVDWEKSQVKIPELTNLSVNESFIFKVKYVKGNRK